VDGFELVIQLAAQVFRLVVMEFQSGKLDDMIEYFSGDFFTHSVLVP
jgi:hypothetical protein